MATNKNRYNTASNILRYEDRKKDNKERFHEECRQLLKQKNKAYQAHLARLVTAKTVRV
jgi:hypothetical protein